jgi:hypothetical protein
MVDGLPPGFYFDDLIKRTAARALERLCPDHDRFTIPAARLFGFKPSALR